MRNSWIVTISAVALALAGCVSAERKAEYAAWQASDDGVRSVMLEEFESKYQQGWRERAAEKKKARLAREEAERVLAARNAEYNRWLASDDKEEGVLLEEFELKYKEGWEDRAAQKRQIRLAKEQAERVLAARNAEYNRWLASDDKEEGVLLEEFEQKYKEGWEDRAAQKKRVRLEREELQRNRDAVRDATAEADIKWIRGVYEHSSICQNPFRIPHVPKWSGSREGSDWLKEWTDSRLELSETDKLAGEAILSEFGNKFMPNAYANYEKKKDAALELQQVFNEEFPEPWKIKNSSTKWNSFNKVLERFARARTEYFMCHDELCHYWVSYRLGVLTADDLARIDAQKIAVRLLPQNVSRVGYTMVDCRKLDEKDADFAAKYAPETYALYKRLEQEWNQSRALVDEVGKQCVLMDAVRFDRAYYNAIFKCNDIAREMNMLADDFQTWHMDHRTIEKSSEDVAKCDQGRAKGLKTFVDSLPTYVKDRTLGRVIPASEMVYIPDGTSIFRNLRTYKSIRKYMTATNVVKSLRIQRTEVTQMQWMIVMGENPSEHIKPDGPVQNVSWKECHEYIKKLNEIDGGNYRLPKESEWEYACRAGSVGRWGKRRNGEEGPFEVMGWNGDAMRPRLFAAEGGTKVEYDTRAVAQKEPNAWGLYDMHGNVCEWCEDFNDSVRVNVYRGGGWWSSSPNLCSADACNYAQDRPYTPDHEYYIAPYPDGCLRGRVSRPNRKADFVSANIGFRLAASQD